MKNLKERLKNSETVHGCWVNLGSTVSAEIIGRSGFDWVLVDLEHGAGNDGSMYQQLQVLAGTPTTSIVRIDDINRPKVQRILDAGAHGIMFPQVQKSEEADRVTRMMYYPPNGTRGMARMVRATGFGKNAGGYVETLNRNLVGVIQIETLSALEQIDQIAAMNFVDVLFVGPSDLTMAMGIFGQLNHERYQKAIRDVASAAQKHKKTAGVLLLDIREYDMYKQLGYRFLACGADASFVAKGADEMIKQMNELSKK
ncbi:MAG TPA: aldolase/citrate lyase family protein [Cyclobacteriaceae bacterium]|nr:aldolase/citrate lyase family protein [Cyclobacteriaceae bacterium]